MPKQPEQEKYASPWPDLSTPRTETRDMLINYRGEVFLGDTLEILFRRIETLEAQVDRQAE